MADDVVPLNNMAAVRARAELFADRLQEHQLTRLQTGYVHVALSLNEAANQIRMVAGLGLTERQLNAVADRLDGIAADTILLGQAHTGDSG